MSITIIYIGISRRSKFSTRSDLALAKDRDALRKKGCHLPTPRDDVDDFITSDSMELVYLPAICPILGCPVTEVRIHG